MTFSTSVVRASFHALPTDTQLEYSRLELHLAAKGQVMQVESVCSTETHLDVTVRISGKFDDGSILTDA